MLLKDEIRFNLYVFIILWYFLDFTENMKVNNKFVVKTETVPDCCITKKKKTTPKLLPSF